MGVGLSNTEHCSEHMHATGGPLLEHWKQCVTSGFIATVLGIHGIKFCSFTRRPTTRERDWSKSGHVAGNKIESRVDLGITIKSNWIYIALCLHYLTVILKALRHGSHSFTCNYTDTYLYLVSVHRMTG